MQTNTVLSILKQQQQQQHQASERGSDHTCLITNNSYINTVSIASIRKSTKGEFHVDELTKDRFMPFSVIYGKKLEDTISNLEI